MKNFFNMLFVFGLAGALLMPAAYASSDFTAGRFDEYDPAGASYRDLGICQFLTGPRAGLEAHRFLLTIGDRHAADFSELQLTGRFAVTPRLAPGEQEFYLSPDEKSAEAFFQQVLRNQLADPGASFTPYALTANVRETNGPGFVTAFDCRVELTGRVDHVGGKADPVSLRFGGNGQYVPGESAPRQSHAVSIAPSAADCPLSVVAPLGLAPVPAQCSTPNCLINFKGYQWWTSYNYYPPPTYFYSQGNQWAPKNAFVDNLGLLHLTIQNRNLGGGDRPSAAEVVAMFNADGSPANFGYGTYLVTTKVDPPIGSWDGLDPNATFGAFTYERIGTGTIDNPQRELDLAEISRWGFASGDPNCPSGVLDPKLCSGNAQFTLQKWDRHSDNLHRYSINPGVNTVTLVMSWPGANQPVTFRQYNGAFTLANLPVDAAYQWTTSAAENPYVPATACERFHLNFWMGNYDKRAEKEEGYHPPPKIVPQEVVVTNFEFIPAQ
jgi:hypothetical protein